MHETSDLEKELRIKAQAIQKDLEKSGFGSPPVIIIIGGIYNKKLDQTIFGSVGCRRLRDFLGILEASKQIATLKHFKLTKSKRALLKDTIDVLLKKRVREDRQS